MAFAKFQGNRFRIDGEIAENMWSWLSIFNVTLGIIGKHEALARIGPPSTTLAQHRANASCLCQLWGSLFAVVIDNDWSTG